MMKIFVLAVVLLAFVQLSNQAKVALPQAVIDLMGSKPMRDYHSLFHNARQNFYGLGPKQKHAIRNYGWEAPRPMFAMKSDGNSMPLYGNDMGEDFLYMHHQMIKQVNAITKDTPYGKVVGWRTCPAPGDRDWPVPANYPIPGAEGMASFVNFMKTDDAYWTMIKPKEDSMFDDDYLRTLTLGQLGGYLENEVHTYMHLRFSAANPVGYRLQNAKTPFDKVDVKWDVPAYDWLADFYSAHVNPTFWQIHGWVESRMEQWRTANGVKMFTWIGSWEGGPSETIVDLEKVSAISEKIPTLPSDTTSDTEDDVEIDAATLTQIVNLLKTAAEGSP
jgi:hypothetical protein